MFTIYLLPQLEYKFILSFKKVCAEEYRRFWITFKQQLIQVGRDGDTIPFLSWENTEEPFKITHVGFATGWGSTGSWIIDEGNVNK